MRCDARLYQTMFVLLPVLISTGFSTCPLVCGLMHLSHNRFISYSLLLFLPLSPGYTSVLEVTSTGQSHFTPLWEALHRCVEELSLLDQDATFGAITERLRAEFPTMELPCEDILRNSLSTMV